jgi:hypothetical protein
MTFRAQERFNFSHNTRRHYFEWMGGTLEGYHGVASKVCIIHTPRWA